MLARPRWQFCPPFCPVLAISVAILHQTGHFGCYLWHRLTQACFGTLRLTYQQFISIMDRAFLKGDARMWGTRYRFMAAWGVYTASRLSDVRKQKWWNLSYSPFPTHGRDPECIGPSESACFTFTSAKGKGLKANLLDQRAVVRALHYEECPVGALASLAMSEPHLLSDENLQGYVVHAPTSPFAKKLSKSLAGSQTRRMMEEAGICLQDFEVLEGDKGSTSHKFKQLAGDLVEGHPEISTEDREHFMSHNRTLTREVYIPRMKTLMHLLAGFGQPQYRSQHILGRQVVAADPAAWLELKELALPGLQAALERALADQSRRHFRSVLTALSALVEVWLQDSVLQIDRLGVVYISAYPQLGAILRHTAWGGFADLVRSGHQRGLEWLARIRGHAADPSRAAEEGVRAALRALAVAQGAAVPLCSGGREPPATAAAPPTFPTAAPAALCALSPAPGSGVPPCGGNEPRQQPAAGAAASALPKATSAAPPAPCVRPVEPILLRFDLFGRANDISGVLADFERIQTCKMTRSGSRAVWEGGTKGARNNGMAFSRFRDGLYAKFLELQSVVGRPQAILNLTTEMMGPIGEPSRANHSRLQTICSHYSKMNKSKGPLSLC